MFEEFQLERKMILVFFRFLLLVIVFFESFLIDIKLLYDSLG